MQTEITFGAERQTIQLRDLRKMLPKNYACDLAARYNLSPSQLYAIASGRIKGRTDIYLELLKMAEHEEKRKGEIAARINHLARPV